MIELFVSNKNKQRILDAGIVKGDFISAAGWLLHYKFEFDHIAEDPELLKIALDSLRSCIENSFTDFDSIVTVGNGATCLGDPLAEQLGAVHLPTTYRTDDSGKEFYFSDDIGDAQSSIIVDDVYTRGTNTKKVKALCDANELGVAGIAVLLNRNINRRPRIGGVPVASVIHKVLK